MDIEVTLMETNATLKVNISLKHMLLWTSQAVKNLISTKRYKKITINFLGTINCSTWNKNLANLEID